MTSLFASVKAIYLSVGELILETESDAREDHVQVAQFIHQ